MWYIQHKLRVKGHAWKTDLATVSRTKAPALALAKRLRRRAGRYYQYRVVKV